VTPRLCALIAMLALGAPLRAQEEARARAEALREEVRQIQRARGYAAAIDHLEPRVDHALLVQTYGDLCVWAGEEERGLRHLSTCAVPPLERLQTELWLLVCLGRYAEAADRAEAAKWTEWVAYARGEAALRERLSGRCRRALWTAAAALLVLALAALSLFRLAPRAPANA